MKNEKQQKIYRKMAAIMAAAMTAGTFMGCGDMAEKPAAEETLAEPSAEKAGTEETVNVENVENAEELAFMDEN